MVVARLLHVYPHIFFVNAPAATEIDTYRHTLSLRDALPICVKVCPSTPSSGAFGTRSPSLTIFSFPILFHNGPPSLVNALPRLLIACKQIVPTLAAAGARHQRAGGLGGFLSPGGCQPRPNQIAGEQFRSEKRSGGEEGISTVRTRWSPDN